MRLFEIFEQVPDPRKPGHAVEHRLIDVLCIALCAMLSGAESFVDMEDYGRAKETWLRERLGLELPHSIPSHDTFNRLFSQLDPQAFEACFVAWTQLLQQLTEGEILAIDGKSVRRSFDTASGQGALHLVSVWASQARLVLAQQAVEQKSNEITAVPLLLEMLDVTGCVVTADALNTQKNIAAKVQERGGDYVLALKENHRHLFEDVRDYFAWCQGQPGGLARLSDDRALTHDWGHGRHEVRRCFCLQTTAEEWPQALRQWAGLQSVVMVERERRILPPEGVPTGGRVVPALTRHYYLSSLAPQAPRLLHAIRAHWGIENSLHWVLDVAFDEDGCRARKDHAAQNLATLRKLALNLLRQEAQAKCGVKARRKMAGWDDDYLLRILAGPSFSCVRPGVHAVVGHYFPEPMLYSSGLNHPGPGALPTALNCLVVGSDRAQEVGLKERGSYLKSHTAEHKARKVPQCTAEFLLFSFEVRNSYNSFLFICESYSYPIRANLKLKVSLRLSA